MNNQQIDKIISFFRINHSFHDPYQFLLDGSFIKLLVEKQLDFKRKLEHILNGRVNLKTTACVQRELEFLGKDFKLVVDQARKHKVIACNHPLESSADQCILEQVGLDNDKNLIICTQDIQLRRSLRYLSNVPLAYFGPDQRITMEDVNTKNLQHLQQQIRLKYLPKPNEMPAIQKYKQQQIKQQRQQVKKQILKLSSIKGIQPKMKKAKGPNPLSIKKKQIKLIQPENGEKQIESQKILINSEGKTKRIRKRNKNKNIHPQLTQ